MIKSGIYLIKNTINNKIYIGSAVDINARWRQHKSHLNNKCHHSPYLQNAWNKYTEWNFEFSVLQYVEDKTQLLRIEQGWLDWLKPYEKKTGYNTCKIAGSHLGLKRSKESIAKLSASNRGLKRSPEICAKFAILRKNITPETRAKMSSSAKGRKLSDASRAKVSAALRVRVRKPETIEKIRQAAINQWQRQSPIVLTSPPMIIED